MSRFWCEWAWLGGDAPSREVTIGVDGERISTVTAGTDPPPDATRLDGLTMPGFANTHSHAFHRALRGLTNRGRGSFWTWQEQMYEAAAGLDPDTYFDLALRTYTEMVVAGYTVVGEFHYLHHGPAGRPYRQPGAMSEAVMAAAETAGIRMTLLDTLYLHGGIDTDGRYTEPNPIQRRFVDQSVDGWLSRLEGTKQSGAVRIAPAIHSVRAVDPAAMETARRWGDDHDAPIHIHLSEQPEENRRCRAAHGMTPTDLLSEVGLLGDRLTAVHATHLTDADMRQLGDARSTVCLCPTTERDLADGIGPSRRLADSGARLAVGSDSQTVIDPFEELRSIEYGQRVSTLTRGVHSAGELVEAGTAGGYRSLGWDGGVIAAGKLADLVTVSLADEVEVVDPADWLPATVFAAAPRHVTTTIVGGTIVHRVPGPCE